jgi:tungstate transport system permease protein
MSDTAISLVVAGGLVWRLDAELVSIVLLSLTVSLSATAIAFVIGSPIGVLLVATRFPGQRIVIVLANALMGLPPVVLGLIIYLLLSQSGPLGRFRLLFTPIAMIIAQAVLVMPIIVALVHRAILPLWIQYGDALQVDGASRLRTIGELLFLGRSGVVTASLAAFGRAIGEVGAVIIVGGNIRGSTRTMTTAIALETSKGDLPLALGLGAILICISLLASATALVLDGSMKRGGE